MLNQSSSECSNSTNYRFSFWFVFCLILNGYASGVPGLSLGSVVYVIMIIFTILNGKNNKHISASREVFLFGVIIVFTSIIAFINIMFFNPQFTFQFSNTFIGFAKFMLWMLMAAVVACEYYDEDSLRIWFCRFSLILTIYLIIQNIAFYFAHIYLPNIFNFGLLRPYAEDYANYDRLSSAQILRAASFLSESSFYGNFIIVTMTLYLKKYINALKSQRILFLLFLALGIVLSGSTSAIIIMGVIFFMYYRRVNSNRKWKIIFVLVFLATIFIFLRPLFVGNQLETSLRYSFEKFTYLDKSTRFGKSYDYLKVIPDSLQLFGSGMGNDMALIKQLTNLDSVYLNSVTSLIVQSGIVGCIAFIVMIMSLIITSIKQKNLISLCLLLAYFVKGFASGIYFSTYGVLFMFIIIGQINKERASSYEAK